jgi:hypothetical protein
MQQRKRFGEILVEAKHALKLVYGDSLRPPVPAFAPGIRFSSRRFSGVCRRWRLSDLICRFFLHFGNAHL